MWEERGDFILYFYSQVKPDTKEVLALLYNLLKDGIKAEAYIGDQTTIDLKKRQQYLDGIEREAN